ncbi:MAG TPA: amino acid adenylation domain-containing protein, partial [Ktedonobacteraceae bacterium]
MMKANKEPLSTHAISTSSPCGLCLHHLFEMQVEQTPDAIAAVFEQVQLTYQELNRRANQLAHYLRRAGLQLEGPVGICLERSLEMVIGLLAVLKAGGAYVPIDPAYPPAHTALLMADMQLSFLVTRTHLLQTLPVQQTQVLCLDHGRLPLALEDSTNPGKNISGANLAYIISTSGSTGRPKGVCICHKSAVLLLEWACQEFLASELASVLATTSLCFDLSLFEILAPLVTGGKTVIAASVFDSLRLATQEQVTLLNTVPSVAATLLDRGSLPASVSTVNLAGEALPGDLVQQLLTQPGVRRICNLYGPTEDTTYSTWMTVSREEQASIPIGCPLPGTQAYVLASSLHAVPEDSSGELYLGGEKLARGYWKRPDLTAERFLPDPFSQTPGSRLYKTGDRVRRLSDGNLAYIGRMDQQIKIRGFRIEAGEVEIHMHQHPAVRSAVVVARGRTLTEKHLVAYVLLKQESTSAELRTFLQERLPAHMVPSLIVILETFPL